MPRTPQLIARVSCLFSFNVLLAVAVPPNGSTCGGQGWTKSITIVRSADRSTVTVTTEIGHSTTVYNPSSF